MPQPRTLMTSRPHDALFKSAFEAPADATALLRALLPPAICDPIAWHTLGAERGSFIGPRLADRHSDLLFSARLRAGERIFLLLEHQSSSDPAMPQRILVYQTRIWERFRKDHPGARLPPIVAVLVSHVPGGWTAARLFHELFDPAMIAIPEIAATIPRSALITLDLAHLSDADLSACPLTAFQKLVLWALRDGRSPPRLLARFDFWRPAILEAGQSRAGHDTLSLLFEYLHQILDPVSWGQLHAKLHALGPSSKAATMTIVDMFREEGRVSTLRRLLVLKFKALDAASEARLQAATPKVLDRYLDRLLTADSLATVFQNPPRASRQRQGRRKSSSDVSRPEARTRARTARRAAPRLQERRARRSHTPDRTSRDPAPAGNARRAARAGRREDSR